MEILRREELGSRTTIEHVTDGQGNSCYRVCHGGVCRFASDRYYADIYAKQFGWSPEAS